MKRSFENVDLTSEADREKLIDSTLICNQFTSKFGTQYTVFKKNRSNSSMPSPLQSRSNSQPDDADEKTESNNHLRLFFHMSMSPEMKDYSLEDELSEPPFELTPPLASEF